MPEWLLSYQSISPCPAIAVIATTLTRTHLFKGLRRWRLFRCPYCVMHWVAIPFADSVTGWLALVAGATLISIALEYYLQMVAYGINS